MSGISEIRRLFEIDFRVREGEGVIMRGCGRVSGGSRLLVLGGEHMLRG